MDPSPLHLVPLPPKPTSSPFGVPWSLEEDARLREAMANVETVDGHLPSGLWNVIRFQFIGLNPESLRTR